MLVQNEKIYIGIDVSKTILDVYILPYKKYMQFKNNLSDIKKLVKKLAPFGQASIVLEATGGYEKLVAQSLRDAKFHLSVTNPRAIRDFAKALGKLAKTDKIDAEVIALFAQKIQPKESIMFNENQQKLADLNARRRQLIDMITMEKNRLDKASPSIKKSIARIIKILEKELEQVNKALANAVQSDASFTQKNTLLTSIKGVGTASSTAVLANLPELGSITAKQVTALAGLAPYNRDSGTLRGKRTIWGGRAPVRCALYMATLVATRHNPQIRSFYQHLCAQGKQKKVALVACMRKLLIIMNAMIKNNQAWNPSTV